MKYVGLDVHVKATVWCCLDGEGQVVERGKVCPNITSSGDPSRSASPTRSATVVARRPGR